MFSFSLLPTPSLPPNKTHFTNPSSLLIPLSKSLNFSPYYFQSKTLCRCVSVSGNSLVSPSLRDDSDEELDRLLALLPEAMRRKVSEHEELHDLVEVVMDLGRNPLARFPSGDFVLSDCPIMLQDIQYATSQNHSWWTLLCRLLFVNGSNQYLRRPSGQSCHLVVVIKYDEENRNGYRFLQWLDSV